LQPVQRRFSQVIPNNPPLHRGETRVRR
jgi:hypothetical protein